MLKKNINKKTSQIYSGRSQDLQEISAYIYRIYIRTELKFKINFEYTSIYICKLLNNRKAINDLKS